ncbi:MAG: dienelactone hydrolase family protein [Rhodospirillales bacterium]
MGQVVRLVADDGHEFSAYRADPEGPPRGSLVVIQEVFGVNEHIRQVCDRFADRGFSALAPALFDRLRPGVELAYDEEGISQGRALVGELGWDKPVIDVAAAARALRPDLKAGVVGYCWGGTVTWLAACRLDVACGVAYYGRQIVDFLDERPRCPVMMHFGAGDALIPLATVSKVEAAFPGIPVYRYEGAGHGFNCDRRSDYRPEAAAAALDRTLTFFDNTLP